MTGSAPIPGTTEYYDIAAGEWKQVDGVNTVGNTTGGSWSGVISKFSDAPEASYYLLALMANEAKSNIYAARGWDGVDPGRYSHYIAPDGTANGGRLSGSRLGRAGHHRLQQGLLRELRR